MPPRRQNSRRYKKQIHHKHEDIQWKMPLQETDHLEYADGAIVFLETAEEEHTIIQPKIANWQQQAAN